MIDIINLSIKIPNIFQFFALTLMGGSIFSICYILDKKNLLNKLLFSIFSFLAAQTFFSFIWRLILGEKPSDYNSAFELLKKFDNTYDIITFNILFLILIVVKHRTVLFSKKDSANVNPTPSK